jgi:hypothetical protein
MRKGQAWSIDAIVGVFLFLIIVISVIAFSMSKQHSAEMEQLKEDGEKLFVSLSEKGGMQAISEKKINPDVLASMTEMDYEELKARLGMSSDFCIYFVDEEGDLVFLDELGNTVGVGSPEVLINGIPCNSS